VLFGLVNNPSFQVDSERGMLRVDYRRQVGKAGVDSLAGWVATVDARDGYAFVQRFDPEPDAEYPEGSSVEFWMNGTGAFYAWGQVNELKDDPETNPYVFESEVLSPYRDLAPGESGYFHYEWYAAKVPPGSEVVAANDVGVTCRPLKCTVAGDGVRLEGSFGVFWTGSARGEFLDSEGRRTDAQAFEVPVSPLAPLVLSEIRGAEFGALAPEYAAILAITILDPSGARLGELARAPIRP
jgi:hypothetical protein